MLSRYPGEEADNWNDCGESPKRQLTTAHLRKCAEVDASCKQSQSEMSQEDQRILMETQTELPRSLLIILKSWKTVFLPFYLACSTSFHTVTSFIRHHSLSSYSLFSRLRILSYDINHHPRYIAWARHDQGCKQSFKTCYQPVVDSHQSILFS